MLVCLSLSPIFFVPSFNISLCLWCHAIFSFMTQIDFYLDSVQIWVRRIEREKRYLDSLFLDRTKKYFFFCSFCIFLHKHYALDQCCYPDNLNEITRLIRDFEVEYLWNCRFCNRLSLFECNVFPIDTCWNNFHRTN